MVNDELKQIYEWLNANKLSLNSDKTKYSLFHKPTKTDDLPLLLPKVLINDRGRKSGINKVPWSLIR